MKDKYKYLVSYVYRTEKGAVEIASRIFTAKKKITSGSDIQLIYAFMEADNQKNPVILNCILLDKKWGVFDWFIAIAELILLAFCIFSLIASIFG